MKEEIKNEKEKEGILSLESNSENLVFYPHEGGGTFLSIVSDPPKNKAALNK